MIEADQLSKTYGDVTAIRDVTFAVAPGEIMGFLGPNGAGKTTTMRILAGFLPASQGTARVADCDVHRDLMAVRQRIGYLPELPPLYPEMTVEGFLHFVARIKGLPAGDRAERVTWTMGRCGLADKRSVLIRKLSKGYRQRVGIAQAIVHNPPVIILDEPTVGLDPRQNQAVRELVKSLAGDHTIILSTHILPEVSMTCDRVTIINGGQVVASGSLDALSHYGTTELSYEVEVAGAAQLAQAQLYQVAGVHRIDVMLDSQPQGDEVRSRLKVQAQPGADPGSAIATRLVGAGMNLYELRRGQTSLEDVFINLTTTEVAEDVAEIEGAETPAAEQSADEAIADKAVREPIDESGESVVADAPVADAPVASTPTAPAPTDSSDPEVQ
jgi:ABC-2 type transport system ATP-binding protein